MNKNIVKQAVEYASSVLDIFDIEVHFKSQKFFSKEDLNDMFIPKDYYIVFRENWLEMLKNKKW